VLEHRDLTERIIGLAIEVHRAIGPGLLESVYEACLCLELKRAGIPFRRQVSMPVIYKGTYLHMSHVRVGLLLNFHATRLKDGIQCFVVW
jgi:hypothetical protein